MMRYRGTPPSLEQAKGMPIPSMNYSFGGGGETSSSSFQGRGSPSTNDDLVLSILKLAAELMRLNLVSVVYPHLENGKVPVYSAKPWIDRLHTQFTMKYHNKVSV